MLELAVASVSVIVNVIKEEIEVLPRCLASVKGLADEIVIIDMTMPGSGVTKIAEKYGADVVRHPLTSPVEKVRNYGISKARGEWILILDPDEELPITLRDKLKKIAQNPGANYFGIPRKNIVFGKWLKHSRWWPDYNIRFFKKGSVTWDEVIHAIPKTSGKGADILPEEKYAIVHHHYESIEQFLGRMNRYTSAQAELKILDGYKIGWSDLIKKPTSEFLSRFFFGEAYKDGIHGLAVSGLQALSEFVVYLKIWQEEKFKEEKIAAPELVDVLTKEQKNLNYWKADVMYKHTGKFIHKLKRKLKLP